MKVLYPALVADKKIGHYVVDIPTEQAAKMKLKEVFKDASGNLRYKKTNEIIYNFAEVD